MKTPLQLGTAKIDITPSKPVPLAGFAHRTGPFEHIAHPLYARIHCLEQSDGSEGKTAALLISADLIWWGTDLVMKLIPQLKDRYGFQTVLLHATHTHSGPQTSGCFTEALGKPDPDYWEELEQRLLAGIEQALQNREPVTIERGVGQCRVGVNRRKEIDGRIKMAPNENGPVDSDVTVLRFRAVNGGWIKGLLVHYTCHPTTTGDNEISSEYCGVALDRIEQALGNNIVGAFLQGCCGDIRPELVGDDEFYRGHRMEVERFGSWLSEEVLRINSLPMDELTPTDLKSKTLVVPLPFESLPSVIELEAQADQTDIYGEWARLLLNQPERRQESIPLEITRLDLAEELSLVTFNAEMVVNYGFVVRDASLGRMLPLGYTNGMIGYVPTTEQLAQGGYESRDSVPYFGLPSPFAPQTEDIICSAIYQLIGEEPNYE
ncbi:neutral/alkaline non-lysosomal ceramidase N-terminal domain-containing protein [Paenibacillus sp. UNC451MF]|uniref:neutral/alkaline non-lysosomal ceramidase N-terminal domain-containing protein n=1 Tax=Paenibacillus sp. UNC451MF TaxID=1449063 RepID=UPI00048A6AA0|nr:neutral/alkaline non-lysosomal ceramidase N-terminal domain-containing protein [Paenibacillus sp. UNC451MF]